MVSDLLQQARLLDNDQQIDLVEAIWDGIVKRGTTSPITPAQKAELDTRLAAYLANPDDVLPWDEVKARIMANLKK
jgi:putative addiction module component (TIGR02574 family)